MEKSISENLDIFSDKKYWTRARKKLLLEIWEGSSNLDLKEVAKKIHKTESTLYRYMRELPFMKACDRMNASLQIQFSHKRIKAEQELFDLLRGEIKKRVEKLRIKGMLKIIRELQKVS